MPSPATSSCCRSRRHLLRGRWPPRGRVSDRAADHPSWPDSEQFMNILQVPLAAVEGFSAPAPCPRGLAGLTRPGGGFCPSRLRQHSGGLKQFRGSWLCPDPGPVTWRPPVHTGPRESKPNGCVRSRHTFPLELSPSGKEKPRLPDGKRGIRCPGRAQRRSWRAWRLRLSAGTRTGSS